MAVPGVLSGYKTYLAATGLFLLAIHHFAAGMVGPGLQSLLTGLVAWALRRALDKLPS